MVLLEFEIIYSGLLFVKVSSYHRRIECDGSHKGAKSIASKTQQEKQRSPKVSVLTWGIRSVGVSQFSCLTRESVSVRHNPGV